jgi:NADP-dependent 3-hydroxy acid dehydrogenase YdfG
MITQPKVILITGASSGIGKTCAEHLAGKGHKVYGIGRNPDFKSIHFQYHAADVCDENAISRLVSGILESEGRIDVLINNAGTHVFGAIEHTDHVTTQHLFDCNFFGSLNMIRAVLSPMRQKNSGMIICVSSIAGITGLPFQGIYCASKFALEGLCESLRMELSGAGVKVVLVEPGDCHTPVTQRRLVIMQSSKDEYYHHFFQNTFRRVSADEIKGIDPIHIAWKIEKILRLKTPGVRYTAGKPVQRLVPFLKRVLPNTLFESIIHKNYSHESTPHY